MRDLAVLIPTRGRPENIRKVIGAWDFTNAWDVADMVLIIDQDDPEIGGYRALVEERNNPNIGQPLIKTVEIPAWEPMVHKLDSAAEALAPGWFALGFAGDDHLPQTINWAQTYLATLHELETGLVHSDDGYQHENICTEWAVTSDVVTTLGRMIPAPVEHMYSDVSLHELMRDAGALRYLPQVRIEHMHPIVGKAENDEQYRRVNSRDQFAKDEREYGRWTREQKAADLAAIKALRPDRPAPVARQRARSNRGPDQQRSGPSRKKDRPMVSKHPFPFSREFQHVRGATPDEIAMTLADLALRVPADQEIVELGVFQGRTALIMAWGAKQGNGAHVTGIDAWDLEGNTYGPPFNEAESRSWAIYRIRELGYTDRIRLIRGFASDVADQWHPKHQPVIGQPKKLVGLLFVDDDHSYAGARRAVEDWAPHLAPGAVIAVDDYGHPDWPGVKEAVDDLVDEGVLEPIEIYHERLAVTRMTDSGWQRHREVPGPAPKAITSEGVSPSPYPAVAGQVAAEVEPVNTESGPPEGWVQDGEGRWFNPEKVVDSEGSSRLIVQEDELVDVDAGTPVADLNTVQLRALAKARGISLGARKDKRSEMLAALEAGE